MGKGMTFKQFHVEQGLCAQKVTSDACLFGAFVAARTRKGAQRMADLGAGTGLLSLMFAQENTDASIDAVELNHDAVAQCRTNFHNSPWAARLHVTHCKVQDFSPCVDDRYDERRDDRYDVVISNPPFFRGGQRPPDGERARARHQVDLPLPDLASAADRLLTFEEDGVFGAAEFWVLLPLDAQTSLREDLKKRGLAPTQTAAIRSTPAKQPHLSITCYQRRRCRLRGEVEEEKITEEEVLTVWRDGHTARRIYHPSIEKYLRPYYLGL